MTPTLPPTRPSVLLTQPENETEVPLPTAPPRSAEGLRPLELPTPTPLPSLEEFLKQSTTPAKVEPIFRSRNDFPSESTLGRKVTSYSETYNGTGPLKTSDMQPPIQEVLARGGITDADIQAAQARGEDIARTRTLPDGRTIRTVVRVNSRPLLVPQSPAPSPAPAAPYVPAFAAAAAPPSLPTAARAAQPRQPDNTIDNFLSQVNLSPEDILAQNGEVVKTFVDRNGRVLSARFVLSTVKGEEQGQGQGQAQNPTK